jgi:hypothetical protein
METNRSSADGPGGRGMDRRTVLRRGGGAAALAVALAATRGRLARAQAPTDFSGLGYPELAVTITDNSFEGVPASTAAGRYLLTATNRMTQNTDNGGIVAFLSGTPVGMSAADLVQFLAGFAGPPPGSPAAGGEEGGGGGEQALPLVVYQLHFAGGVFALSGATAQAVIDLTPGEYVVWGDDPTAPQTPATVRVTGEFPPDATEPTTDVTATLIDFAIRMEGNLTAGPHLLKVQHEGAQPHFLELDKGPDTMTKEQVQAALMGEVSGTPAAGGLAENDLQPVFFSPTQSIGTVTYHRVELTAGTFLAACFFPTAGTGAPHAANGMIEVFKVTG